MSTVLSLASDLAPAEVDAALLADAATGNLPGGFVSIVGYRSQESGEVADHIVNGNVSYENCLVRSIAMVKAMSPEDIAAACPACDGSVELATRARMEVLASWEKSLLELQAGNGTTSNYEYLAPGVATLPTENGEGAVYIWGLAVEKTVRVPGEYKPVKSKPLTLVKAFVQKGTPCSRFRRFKLTALTTFEAVRMAGREITPAQLAAPVAVGQ